MNTCIVQNKEVVFAFGTFAVGGVLDALFDFGDGFDAVFAVGITAPALQTFWGFVVAFAAKRVRAGITVGGGSYGMGEEKE